MSGQNSASSVILLCLMPDNVSCQGRASSLGVEGWVKAVYKGSIFTLVHTL